MLWVDQEGKEKLSPGRKLLAFRARERQNLQKGEDELLKAKGPQVVSGFEVLRLM